MKFKAIAFDYNGVLSDGSTVDKQMLELVDRLRSRGYKTAILSNFGRSGYDMIKAEGTAEHFDVVHVSGLTGFAKPQPDAFKHLAESLEIEIDELIYIDDSSYNLSTAHTVGFNPILFSGLEDLIKRFDELTIKD